MNLDTDGFYSWRALDGSGSRGAGGVTDHSERAVELLFAALRNLQPGATGSVRIVRLDRHASKPSYTHGSVVFRTGQESASP